MLALYSNPGLLSVVRGAVERLTETLGFPAVQCRSITRAVDEAVTNIVRHSYGNRLDHPSPCTFEERSAVASAGKSNMGSKYSFVIAVWQLTRTSYGGGRWKRYNLADWDCT